MKLQFNNTEIKVTRTYIGTATPWGGNYIKSQNRVTITANGKRCSFMYYCSTNSEWNEQEYANAVWCFCLDATSYLNSRDIDGFASEFDYTKVSEAVRVYNACKKAADKFKALGLDPFDLSDYLSEKYDL